MEYSLGGDARLWTGVVDGTWDQSTTTNFMGNAPSDPLVQADFDDDGLPCPIIMPESCKRARRRKASQRGENSKNVGGGL